MSSDSKRRFRKLLVPFSLSLLIGIVIFYGGDAYQLIGLTALKNAIDIFGYALGIAEFIALAVFLKRIVQYVFLDNFLSNALGAPAPRLLSQMSAVIIYALAIAAIASLVFKKDLTVMLATFGGASIVVGFALQGFIQDLFAGLTINLDQSIKMGDYIRVHAQGTQGAFEGQVVEISWRSLQLMDSKLNTIILPNSFVQRSIFTNYSRPEQYYILDLPIVMDHGVPTEKVRQILQTALVEATPLFSPLNAPTPSILIDEISLQGVVYMMRIYPTFATRTRARTYTMQMAMKHLRFAGLTPACAKQEQISHDNTIETDNSTLLAHLLATTYLFKGLDVSVLRLIAENAVIRHLPQNTLIVQSGDIADFMFFIEAGLVSAKHRQHSLDKTAIEEILGPGSLINGVQMLAGGSYERTIHSKTDVLIYEINYAVIEKLLQQKPEMGSFLSHRVAQRILDNIAKGTHSYYQSYIPEDINELTEKVFKNFRRTFAHLKIT